MKSLLLLLIFVVEGCYGYKVVCVYTNWSQYRPDGAKFLPEDVDASLCTHLIYVYAKLKGNKLEPAEWNDDGSAWSEGMYERVNNLKQINPEMKTLLGVGGWMMGSKAFSKLAAGKMSRKIFAKTSVKFLRDRKFDGLSIDWQHPTKRGGKPQDKVNFSLLLKEIRKAFQDDSTKTGLPPLLLTAGVSASREVIEDGYEINNMTKYTDFLNVMAYDLHGAWDNYTGHPSQLYPREEEFGPSTEINVDSAMRFWMSKVPDRSKLILGVSTYGRTFTLRKTRHNDYNVPTTGPGDAGEFTQQPGMLAYYERCSQYADARRVWDATSQVAYWHKGNQWIAGEDIESVKAKVNWTRTYEIGGLMLWSLDTDDFDDMCLSELYPLLNGVVTALNDPTFVKSNISLDNHIKQMPSKTSVVEPVKSISKTKVLDNKPQVTTAASTRNTTTSGPTTISVKINSKTASKMNSKIMTTKNEVKANVNGQTNKQPLDKTNKKESIETTKISKSRSNIVKSTKHKRVKQKGKRKRMSPRMRRMMMLRRKQQQNRKKQLKSKDNATKPTAINNKNKNSNKNGVSTPSSMNVQRMNKSMSKANPKPNNNNGKVKESTGKNKQAGVDLKQQAKKTTKIKLAINESSVDENILTKDMLIKSRNEIKASKIARAKTSSNVNKVTVGKTLSIATKDSAIPVINIKRRNMRKKVRTKTKSVKSQKDKKSLDQTKEKSIKQKQLDSVKETTTINIRQNKDSELNLLDKSKVQKNVISKSKQRKPAKRKMKWRRRKVSKKRKRVKVRRRKTKPETKVASN